MTIAFDARVAPRVAPRVPRGVPVRTGSTLVLTRRGRFVVALFVVMFLAAGVMLFSSTGAANQEFAAVSVETVKVHPGDTLWSIASEANPKGDIRKTIAEIVRLNALEKGASLPAGVTLSVPVYE